MDELVKEYMLGLLNLGWTQDNEIKTELQLIEMAAKKVKEEL